MYRPDILGPALFGMVALLVAGCVAPPAPVPGPRTGNAPAIAAAREDPSGRPATEALASPPPPDRVTIERLMGANEVSLNRLLGPPQFHRRDPPARLVRYRATSCLLDLFLYPGEGGVPRVTHIEARGRDGNDKPAAACLESIIDARQKAKTG